METILSVLFLIAKTIIKLIARFSKFQIIVENRGELLRHQKMKLVLRQVLRLLPNVKKVTNNRGDVTFINLTMKILQMTIPQLH